MEHKLMTLLLNVKKHKNTMAAELGQQKVELSTLVTRAANDKSSDLLASLTYISIIMKSWKVLRQRHNVFLRGKCLKLYIKKKNSELLLKGNASKIDVSHYSVSCVFGNTVQT